MNIYTCNGNTSRLRQEKNRKSFTKTMIFVNQNLCVKKYRLTNTIDICTGRSVLQLYN